jgi:hypothetical protein
MPGVSQKAFSEEAVTMMVVVRLTRSQQMALLDVLMAYSLNQEQPQEFVNCSTVPPTTTTVGDLLLLLNDVAEFEVRSEPGSPSREIRQKAGRALNRLREEQ